MYYDMQYDFTIFLHYNYKGIYCSILLHNIKIYINLFNKK